MVERRRMIFSGRVQGVGFRMTAVQFADDLPLSGTVQNLPDGDVELVIEGESADITALLDRLREHFQGLVRTVSQDRLAPLALPAGVKTRGIRVLY